MAFDEPATGADEAPVTLRLDDKVALVTGAGSPDGIGYATARRLRDLGAQVAIVSTTRRIHDRASELGVTGFVADLTDESEVGALADAITDALGDVEVLVNNAGLASRASPEVLRPVAQLTYDEWRAEIDRNLSTAFLCSRAFVGGMAERGWGRIVNLAATAGPVNALPTEAAYAAAKAGVVGLTRALAMELVADGVIVNCVAPGDRFPVLARRVVHHRADARGGRRQQRPRGRIPLIARVAMAAEAPRPRRRLLQPGGRDRRVAPGPGR
jgi:3-oxoacyl-[acyl-carrier protein] reductase